MKDGETTLACLLFTVKTTFAAPWATSLKIISLLATLLLVTVAWFLSLREHIPLPALWAIRVLPVLLTGACALFTVRGYELDKGELRVRRLLWRTRIPLHSLVDAEWRQGPFGRAMRTCGNGGLFSFSGWFYQKGIGSFRALATRTGDAVILTFRDRKPIVVTPGDPAGFVQAASANGGHKAGGGHRCPHGQ